MLHVSVAACVVRCYDMTEYNNEGVFVLCPKCKENFLIEVQNTEIKNYK